MSGKERLSPEKLLEQFSPKFSDSKLLRSEITTSQLSDALMHLTGTSGVIPGIKPITGIRTAGRAVTVKTMAKDWGTVVKAIDIALKDDIILIQSDGDDYAVWGEITSKTAHRKKIAGTIVDGAVRDVAAIKRLNYPVFSKSIVPNAGSPIAEGEINVPLTCGETTVKPRDLIMGDECGVVAVPQENASEVIKEALHIKKTEDEIIRKIERGISFSKILGIK